MKTSLSKKERVFSTAVQALIDGVGSILDLSGSQNTSFTENSMARQDRDGRALRGDWQQVGRYLRSSMDNETR